MPSRRPEAAERLERRQVGVLDAVELRQALGRPHGVGAEIGQRRRSIASATAATRVGRRVDQQQPIALPARETAAGSSPPTSAARPGRCCRPAPRPGAAGSAGRRDRRRCRRRATCGGRRSSSSRRRSPGSRHRPCSRSSSSHGFARSASVVRASPGTRSGPASMNVAPDAEDPRAAAARTDSGSSHRRPGSTRNGSIDDVAGRGRGRAASRPSALFGSWASGSSVSTSSG